MGRPLRLEKATHFFHHPQRIPNYNRKTMGEYKRGIRKGMPICLGYFPVAFTFGILAVKLGFTPLSATVMAITNMASAGQMNGVQRIVENASFVSLAITTLVVNLRYMLMSFSLTQKIEAGMPWYKRCIISLGICDEMFVLASMEEKDVSFEFYAGLMTMPVVGWTLGTLFGSIASELFSPMLQGCMGMALYCMFIAIIVPEARKSRKVAAVSILAIALSCIFTYVPYINILARGGWGMIIAAITAAATGATIKEYRRRRKERISPTDSAGRSKEKYTHTISHI